MFKVWTTTFSVFLSLFISAISLSAEKDLRSINLLVKTPFNTPLGSELYLTGDGESLCNWRPKCLKFRKVNSQLYKINLVLINRPKLLEFKVTRGSWKSEACSQKGEVLPNFEVMTNGGSVDYTITIENWCDQQPYRKPKQIVSLKDFHFQHLGLKRNIEVYLPSNYYQNENRRFPVIYVHDGQNTLNPNTAAFGKEWGIDETIETLIERKKSNGFIVVAIPCHCRERNAEYNYFEKGADFAKSLVQDLVPYIDQRFRTIARRDGRFTMGSSMGALISFSILWEYPEVFKAAAGLSFPAFAYDYFIFDVASTFNVPGDTFFYLDHGGRGQDATYDESREMFLDHLHQRGVWPHQVFFKHFPLDGHNEVDWANRVNEPIRFFQSLF